MLTDSERAWLKYRDIVNPRGTYFCEYCKDYAECHSDMGWGVECPTAPLSLHDAALFEARVAAKLANPQWAVCWNSDSCLEFDGSKDEPRWWWNCAWCRLKHARLQVEEEMDAEMGK